MIFNIDLILLLKIQNIKKNWFFFSSPKLADFPTITVVPFASSKSVKVRRRSLVVTVSVSLVMTTSLMMSVSLVMTTLLVMSTSLVMVTNSIRTFAAEHTSVTWHNCKSSNFSIRKTAKGE